MTIATLARRRGVGHAGYVEILVAGGQTGVDRAAMDVALSLGIHCAGWCPRGRQAEDGTIPARYPLRETPSSAALQRTLWNLRRSDATLILCRKRPIGGTALTIGLMRRLNKPYLVVNPMDRKARAVALTWLIGLRIQTLNIAGPRASQDPMIHDAVTQFLFRLLQDQPDTDGRSGIRKLPTITSAAHPKVNETRRSGRHTQKA